MHQKRTKQGFTLAELLIVIAIIGVLAAVAIPVFTSSLDHARETVCLANRTAAQHLLAVEEMTEGLSEKDVTKLVADGVGPLDKLCPSGGTYIFKDKSPARDGTSWLVKCTKHGMAAVDIVKLAPTKLLNAERVKEYFSQGKNALDSTGPNFGQDGRKEIAEAVGTTQAFDFRIYKEGNIYKIYVSGQLPEEREVSKNSDKYKAWPVTRYTINEKNEVTKKEEGTLPLISKTIPGESHPPFVVMDAANFAGKKAQ